MNPKLSVEYPLATLRHRLPRYHAASGNPPVSMWKSNTLAHKDKRFTVRRFAANKKDVASSLDDVVKDKAVCSVVDMRGMRYK